MKLTPKRLSTFCSLILIFLLPSFGNAQAYQINIDIPAYRDSQLIVAGYYFGNLFVKDTLQLNSSGHAIFQGVKPLDEGIYQLYLNNKTSYDFLVGSDQKFNITIPAGSKKAEIKGAVESEKFQGYINFLAKQKNKFHELSDKEQRLSPKSDSLQKVKTEIQKLDKDVKKYRFQEGTKNKDNFYGKVLLAGHQVELDDSQIPPAYQARDSLKWVYEYNFRKNHYWDYFDLGDIGLWHTPFVKDRLTEYFNRVLLQSPDSVLPEAIRIIEEHRDNPELFQNLTSFLTNNSIQSKVMGMENVFVALAERYYLSGQASWADEKTLENIGREVALRKNNLVGHIAPELLLEGANGEFHSLHQSPTAYTLLVFWEPGCSHCKHEIPKLYDEIFLKAKPSQLSVYAVYTMTDKKEWTDFIDEHELNDWMNLWDPTQISDMKLLYGVRTTPSLFLLDKDKKIVAKQLDIPGMKRLLKVLNVMQ
ncbi:TlpA disulfide reductase family protein [Mangrovibacterium diazotrophicum]|uniref:Thiol-disulfide isomerase/thioredoxin n=1 Tax=Mangrovibacterium diazotrophicum TaxID=1261403 RepID=A0A419VYR4_9BACT|nr:TlpA disulfide reductase family protein [Mangrovibacterium diazotrophicum]RKD88385.1 thiol-disulfide isomerase/thioredoxin [Mangrovibacterium diazotrophicum]